MALIVSSDFQITIPKEIRKEMGLEPGDLVSFVGHPKRPRFVRVPELEDMIGSLRGCDVSECRDETDRY